MSILKITTIHSKRESQLGRHIYSAMYCKSHQERRGFPELCINSLSWLWPSKIHAFLQRTEILLIRCNRAADIHRNAQVSFRLLYIPYKSKQVLVFFVFFMLWFGRTLLAIMSYMYLSFCLYKHFVTGGRA